MEGVRVVLLGLADEVELEVGEERVVAIEQRQIDGDALLDDAIFEVIGHTFAIARVGDALAERREVVLVAGHLDVGEELTAFAHEVQSPAEQVARGAHAGRVDVRLREQAAAQQGCDLQGVEAVVLCLAAVDRLHVERVAEDEGDALARTGRRASTR